VPLDPAVKSMLDLLAGLDAPPMSAGEPTQARQTFHDMVVGLRQPQHVIPVGETEDITVDGAEGQLAARVYRPQSKGPAPTIAFFHGGGFVIGDIETHDNQARWICRETGSVVVSVDYRLAPEAPWPAAADDCFAATQWVGKHVDELGGDPDRIAVGGDSAGGNLAAVVAQLCRDAGGPALAAQLLIYPATDFEPDLGERYPSRAENATGYFLTADDMLWFSGHYLADADVADPKASPMRGELGGLPPAVVVTAEFDPLRDEGEAYADALRAAGVTVRSRRFDGLIHGFFDLPALSPAAADAVRATCADLRSLLA
jgi:acetyl esterase